MDNGGVSILRKDLAMYASVTPDEEGLVLWYPDRKFFLLGRRLHAAMFLIFLFLNEERGSWSF